MADFCKTCKHCDTGEYDEPCFSCRSTGGGIPTKWEAKANCKPQTNADRIRAMSDEDLAKFIPDWSYTKACKCDELPHVDCNNECSKCVLEWLKQPAEEGTP